MLASWMYGAEFKRALTELLRCLRGGSDCASLTAVVHRAGSCGCLEVPHFNHISCIMLSNASISCTISQMQWCMRGTQYCKQDVMRY